MTPLNGSIRGAIRVRPMAVTDLDRVVELAETLNQAPQWQREAYLAALDQKVVRRIALVADDLDTGAIVGFAVASLSQPDAELETIGVAAGFQRRGVARHLFDEMVKGLRAAESESVVLEVRASNIGAREVYKSLGFVEIGRRPRYYCDPLEEAVLMRLGFK